VFGKTGTLTEGKQGVVDLVALNGVDEQQAIWFMAALEADSEHPIARAIVDDDERRGLSVPQARDFRALPGRGVQANVTGRVLKVGAGACSSKSGSRCLQRCAIERLNGEPADRRSSTWWRRTESFLSR